VHRPRDRARDPPRPRQQQAKPRTRGCAHDARGAAWKPACQVACSQRASWIAPIHPSIQIRAASLPLARGSRRALRSQTRAPSSGRALHRWSASECCRCTRTATPSPPASRPSSRSATAPSAPHGRARARLSRSRSRRAASQRWPPSSSGTSSTCWRRWSRRPRRASRWTSARTC
jgi:hypothetical protein